MPATKNLRIEHRPPQHVACVERTATDVGMVIQELLPATFEWVGRNGGQPAGAPFTRYLDMSRMPAEFRLEIGVPVVAPIPPEGQFEMRELPGGDIAVGDHYGPYETVIETAERLREFIEQQGRSIAGPLWESYTTDPGEEPDPEKWHTEVCYPLS
jgi:effector-binding domain-containing protein